jgi:MFS family permease
MKKNNLFRYSIVAALAGFIFGFDTVVISGANEPIKKLWDTSPLFHGIFIMSMALWGTVAGALIGGIPAERFGRKKTLFWVGIFLQCQPSVLLSLRILIFFHSFVSLVD